MSALWLEAGAALLFTGCAASYMMGYASQTRTVCVRWAVQSKDVGAAPLTCVEVAPDPVVEAP